MIQNLVKKKSIVIKSILCLVVLPLVSLVACTPLEETYDDFDRRELILIESVSGTTTEQGGTASFTVRLEVEPSNNVTLNLTVSDSTEGELTPSSVTFTSTNWNDNQTITVTGVDDNIFDGSQNYTATVSSISSQDSSFSDFTSTSSAFLVNADNDTNLSALRDANFTLLRTGSSCPSGFESGSITIDTEDESNVDRLSGSYGDIETTSTGINMHFCSTTSVGEANVTAMKNGSFIVLRSNSACPSGYNTGGVNIDTENDNNQDAKFGNTGDSYLGTNTNIFLTLCESNNDSSLSNLAGSQYTIFKNGDCPLGSEEGYLHLDTEDNQNVDTMSGNIGSSELSSENTRSIYLRTCTFTRT